jgi:hypothetical protein
MSECKNWDQINDRCLIEDDEFIGIVKKNSEVIILTDVEIQSN